MLGPRPGRPRGGGQIVDQTEHERVQLSSLLRLATGPLDPPRRRVGILLGQIGKLLALIGQAGQPHVPVLTAGDDGRLPRQPLPRDRRHPLAAVQ